MIEWLLLGFAVLLILGNAFFVAAEFGLITVDRATVESDANNGDKRSAGVLSALKALSTQLSGAQLGITITSLAVGYITEPSLARLLVGPLRGVGVSDGAIDGVSVACALFIATGVQMVIGELVPKNLALSKPLEVARVVIGGQRAFTALARPGISFLNRVANAILRLLKIEPQEELRSARSPSELSLLVQRSQEHGTLEASTATLLTRSLEFGDRRAVDVMTPRVKMQTIKADAPVSEVIDAVRLRGHSRFPVVGGETDDVVGIVHVKHAVAVPSEQRNHRNVGEIMVKPVLVPGAAQLDPLLTTLREKGLQMAVVVDEYGSTDGLVTLEDLIEELVGDIADEFDRPGSHARRRRDGSWSISGLLRPDEAATLTGIVIPEDKDYDTLGGLVLDHLGRLPVPGDVVAELATTSSDNEQHPVTLTVERMDGMRVDRIRLEVAVAETEPESVSASLGDQS